MPRVRWTLPALVVSIGLATAWVASAGGAGAQPVPHAAISITPPTSTGDSPLAVRLVAQSGNFSSPVTSWLWVFGDDRSAKTHSASVTHTYPSRGVYSVKLTETSTATAASATGTLGLFPCPVGSDRCTASLPTPGAVQDVTASGPIDAKSPAFVQLFADPWRFPDCNTTIDTAAALTDSGFTGDLDVTVKYITTHPNQVSTTCFASTVAFSNAAGAKVRSGALPMCAAVDPVAPCVESISRSASVVTKLLLVPPGDPKVGAG